MNINIHERVIRVYKGYHMGYQGYHFLRVNMMRNTTQEREREREYYVYICHAYFLVEE